MKEINGEHHHLLKLESLGYTELQPPRTSEGSDISKNGRQCSEGDDGDEIVPEAEYVNPRCVIFTFYSGDVNVIVDEQRSIQMLWKFELRSNFVPCLRPQCNM